MKFFKLKNDFATVPKIERLMKSRFSKVNLDFYRNNDGSYTITTDRAEVATLSFKVFSRSFDMIATDMYDFLLEEPISYHGSNWKEFLSRRLDEVSNAINKQKVPKGYIIRHNFNGLLKTMMAIHEIDRAKTGDNRQTL